MQNTVQSLVEQFIALPRDSQETVAMVLEERPS
jgi:hypothetical protein